MLANEDEVARQMFAVYVRPEGGVGEINFYPDEASAQADVGPGMPEGVITHGDTYVEYIGDALLFAPANWPLIGVSQDLLVQLETDDFEIFVALSPQESDALMLLGAGGGIDAGGVGAVEELEELEDAEEVEEVPEVITGTEPCAVWRADDGAVVLYQAGVEGLGRIVGSISPRPELGDEVATDRAVVMLMEAGWVPLIDDTHLWRSRGDLWVINLQQRVHDDDEEFLGRFTADDESLVVTRSGSDTDYADEHLQVVAQGVACDFPVLEQQLLAAGWQMDPDAEAPAEASVHPDLSESPGWYPAEATDGVEWVCGVRRIG